MPEQVIPARTIFRECFIAIGISGIAPLVAGFFFTVPPGPVIALVSATLILEYGAVFIGTALGMEDILIFIIVSLVAAGIIFIQLSLFDLAGKSSPRVAGFLERTHRKYGSSPFIKKYGVFALVPGILVVGFYVCPAVAWLIGWDRKTAFIVMIGTFCIAAALLLPVSEGLIQWTTSLVVKPPGV
jgi:hypothetical protein